MQRRIIFFWDRVAAPASLLRRTEENGAEEGEVERGDDKASYRGGAGPDGIALPVSCLSRHVLAGPTRNRLDYLDDSSLVRYTRARWLLASVALVATGSPGTPGPMSLVLTSPPLPSPPPPFLLEVVLDRRLPADWPR